MTYQEQLIREAVAAEAAEAVDSRDVLAALHRGRARRRRPWALIAAATVATVAAAIAVVVPLTLSRPSTPAPPATPLAEPHNVLLVGLDEGGRTDSVVLAHVTAAGAVNAVSLPRDAWVDVPGGAKAKLNTIYGRAQETATGDRVRAGAQALLGAVGQLTGARIDHYAVVEMSALGRLVDAVDGVEVCLKAPAKEEYSGVDLPAGRQTIGGDAAVAFMRQRHDLPRGDLDRVVRQQAVLRALAGKYLSPEVLGDPAKLGTVVDVATAQTRTDEGWNLLDFARGLTPGAPVRAATIPVGESTFDQEAGQVVQVDPAAVRAFVTDFTGETPSSGTPGTPAEPADGCVA